MTGTTRNHTSHIYIYYNTTIPPPVLVSQCVVCWRMFVTMRIPLLPTMAAIAKRLPLGVPLGLSSQALVIAFQKVIPAALSTEMGQDVLLEAHYCLRPADMTAVLLHAHQRKCSKDPRFHPCMGPL